MKMEVINQQTIYLLLQGYNLLSENAVLEDILGLSMKDLCERRIQTVVLKKNLARSIKQARQFITHEHILVGDRKITSPSYLVNDAEELMIKFSDSSSLVSEDHPERVPEGEEVKKEMIKVGLKKEEEPNKEVEVKKQPKEEIPKEQPEAKPADEVVEEAKEEPNEEVLEEEAKEEIKEESTDVVEKVEEKTE